MLDEKYEFKSHNGEKFSSLIEKLTALNGVSGNECEIAAYLKNILTPLCDKAEIDKNGNVIAQINSVEKNAKTIMLEAHLDRIGLMVSKICDNGMIKFVSIGGIDARILPGDRVSILGKETVLGIIDAEENDDKKSVKTDKMFIDTGFSLAELKDKIKVGDMIVINSKFVKLLNDRVSSAAMDNRAGIAAILDAITSIKKEKLKYNIAVLFSVQEELGLHGAFTGTEAIKPDIAVVVDVTHGSTYDTKDMSGVFPLGCGTVICRGPNFDYNYTKQLIKICDETHIPYKIEVASGPSGTSAWATQISGGGIPSMLVSIPLRYMHTNVETLDIRDVDATSKLMKYVLEEGFELD